MDIDVRAGFTPVVPARLVDTRPGEPTVDGRQSGSGRLPATSTLSVEVAGRGGVPEAGVRAVMLNVTAVAPSEPGFLTVYPNDSERPNSSNVNYAAGEVVARQVLADVSSDGRVAVYTMAASDLIVDVVGWIDADAAARALVPARLADSRPDGVTVDGGLEAFGTLGAGRSVAVDVLGRGGVPSDGVGTVIVSVVAANPRAPGFLTVHPDGEELPLSSTVNYGAGETVANQAVAKLGPSGRFRVYTSADTDVVVDVVGWVPERADFVATTPSRFVDTRADGATIDGLHARQGQLQPNVPMQIDIGGRSDVPAEAGAVMLNVTAVNPAAAGFITVYPGGEDLPGASSLNFSPGAVVANQVMVKLGRHSRIQIFSPVATDVIVDLVGWMPPGLNQPLNNVVPLTEVVQSVEVLAGGPNTGSATFPIPQGVELFVDDVVVFETPDGSPFYGEVTSITAGVATATEVSLTEVIPSGSFEFVADANTGVIQRASFAEQSARDVIESGGVLDGISVATESWEASCSAGVDGDVEFDYYLDALSFGGGADWGLFYASAELYYRPKIGFEATAALDLAGSCTLTVPIAEKDLPKIKFSIGAIPVVIEHSIGVALEVEIGAESAMTVSAGATVTARLGVGISTRDGLYPIREFNLQRHFSSSSETTATLSVGLPISYEAGLYGMIGATLTVTPKVVATLSPAADKWLTVTAQVDVGVDLWVKIKISIKLFIRSVSFDVSKSVELATATVWGPSEIYSRTRSRNAVTMGATMPTRTAVGAAYAGSVSLPTGTNVRTTWRTPGLPAGLTFTGTNTGGTVSGAATAPGVRSFGVNADIRAASLGGNEFYAQRTFTLDVAPRLSAGTQLDGVGEVGRPFVGVASATGGVGPYTWTATGLPAGVRLANGSTPTSVVALVGTPTTATSGTAQITVRDSAGSAPVSFSVPWSVAPSLTITAGTFPVAGVGVPYSQSFTLTGGVDPINHTITGVPYGMTVVRSGRTVTIVGTPQIAGAAGVRLAATSRLGGSTSLTRYFEIRPALSFRSTVVNVPVDPNPMQLTDGWLTVIGGRAPYTWTVSDLPAGITFDTTQNGSRARFVGSLPVPTSATVTVSVVDSSLDPDVTGEILLRSNGTTTFVQSSLPGGALGAPYDASVSVTGGRAPYRWSARGLPAGIALVPGATSDTVSLAGTPTGPAGNYRIELTVGDDTVRPAVVATFPITVAPPLAMVAGSLPNGVVGTTYSPTAELAVTGGVAPYTWTVTGLPDGVSLDTNTTGATRRFDGAPTAVGTSTVSISVADASGSAPVTATRTITVAPALSLSVAGLPTDAFTDVDYAGNAVASGGNAPITVTATGLPSGLSMAANGTLSGRPTATGSFPVSVRATDAAGYTRQASFTMRSIAPLTLDVSLAPTSLGTGQNYNGSVSATGGIAPYTYSIAYPGGTVPSFATLVASTGVFAGTSPATTAGTYPLEVTVTDADGREATRPLTIAVATTPPLSIAATGLPGVATVGTPYTASPTATGGITPYTWSLDSAPAWMTISPSTGAISGTPESGNGVVDVTIRAVGGLFSDTRTYSLDIRPPVTINTASMPTTGTAGANYTGTVTVAGGRNATLSVSGLPANITASTTGSTTTISGRPLVGSTSTITLTATDADGRTATTTVTLTIAAAPALALDTSTMPTSVSLLTPSATYEGTATVSGGVTPYAWAFTGVPAGVTATGTGSTATFSGRPATGGTFPIGITVTDAAGSEITRTVTVTIVVESMAIDISDLWTTGHSGRAESLGVVTATGGTTPYTFSATGMPPGLSIDPVSGEVSGTATTNGTYNATITVSDAASPAVTRSATWSVTVRTPIPIATPSLPSEFSTTVFVPIHLPGWTGAAPTFSTVARFSDGTSKTNLFSCTAYGPSAGVTHPEHYGCLYEYDGITDDHSGFTLDIFASSGTLHGAWRGTVELSKQKKTVVSMGLDYGCAVYEDTTIRCWGSNDAGQLGNANATRTATMHQPVPVTDAAGETLTGFTAVAANANVDPGKAFTCAIRTVQTESAFGTLTDAGTVWCWGYGLDGQLGNNATLSSATPVRVRQSYGPFTGGTGVSPRAVVDALELHVGGTQACAHFVGHSGEWSSTSLCWGTDWQGTVHPYAEPPVEHAGTVDAHDRVGAIGATHICFAGGADLGLCDGPARLTGEATRGQNQDGSYPHQLGIAAAGTRQTTDDTGVAYATSRTYAESISTDRSVVWDHVAGHSHTCLLEDESIEDALTSGVVRCFGDNDNYQIGSSSTLDKVIATDWLRSSFGVAGVAVNPDTNLNNDYQTRFAYSGPYGRFTDIAAGGDVSCGVRTTSVHNTMPPAGVTSAVAGLVCWGKPYVDTDPRAAALITTDVDWEQITVGPNAACALKASGALYCWGANSVGQLGLGSNVLASGNVFGQHRPYPSNA
jgi:hypothetical protein